VLIADDDPDILRIVTLCLQAEGYPAHSALNGREAVAMAAAHHPDLILMDMMMPELSGFEAAAAGIDGYITKPFRVAQVLAVVRSHLKV
jgi:CheY-like chemotaxis protein